MASARSGKRYYGVSQWSPDIRGTVPIPGPYAPEGYSDSGSESGSDYEEESADQVALIDYYPLEEQYGQGKGLARGPVYYWHVILKLNKIMIKDRLYRTKGEAINTAAAILRNYSSPDAGVLAKKVLQLSGDNPDNISLSQGNYAVDLERLYVLV